MSVRFVDIEIGMSLPRQQFRITRADLIRYAGASGDFNPVHWSDRQAAAVGLPGVIAHGMLTMGRAARVLTEWVGDPARVVSYEVRFNRPVLVPDDDTGTVVTVSAVVAEKLDGSLVRVDITASVDDAEVLTRASALLRLA
ncbi:MAG: hypothetical protein QOE61_2965 [Micromonosporaceae bacterium]|jgi:acyl dehydratase|nr:hypothetical protein [Micromonosporaceae bacterium]